MALLEVAPPPRRTGEPPASPASGNPAAPSVLAVNDTRRFRQHSAAFKCYCSMVIAVPLRLYRVRFVDRCWQPRHLGPLVQWEISEAICRLFERGVQRRSKQCGTTAVHRAFSDIASGGSRLSRDCGKRTSKACHLQEPAWLAVKGGLSQQRQHGHAALNI